MIGRHFAGCRGCAWSPRVLELHCKFRLVCCSGTTYVERGTMNGLRLLPKLISFTYWYAGSFDALAVALELSRPGC